jgi:hypothetical protein
MIGRPFNKSGRAGWPYLELEVLDLRSIADIRECRYLLGELHLDDKAQTILDRDLFANSWARELQMDLTERAQYLERDLSFCEMVDSDIPWLISEGSHMGMSGPLTSGRNFELEMREQALSSHPNFKDALVARNSFRCFHREDGKSPLSVVLLSLTTLGVVMTMSPAGGVGYINRNFSQYLNLPGTELNCTGHASPIAQIFEEFAQTGTNTWYRATVEWFLVYLITEMGALPHNIRHGYNVVSIMDAYENLVHDIVSSS